LRAIWKSNSWFTTRKKSGKKRSLFNAALWFVLSLILSIALPTAIAYIPGFEVVAQVGQQVQHETQQDAAQLANQGKADYQAGRFEAAVNAWQQAAAKFAARGDRLNQAMALSNLSLAHQQLGQWERANEAIASSLNLLQTESQTKEYLRILAQSLDIQGRLQLEQGKAELAVETWQKAAPLYAQLNDKDKIAQNLINQSQALQSLGLYRRACKTVQQSLNLTEQNCDITEAELQALKQQQNSAIKVVGARSLGDIFRKVGQLDRSEKTLQESLRSAKEMNLSEEIGAIELSLGNTYYAIAQRDEELRKPNYQDRLQHALRFYKSAMQSASPVTRIQARLNQLRLSVQVPELASNTQDLSTQIQSELAQLPSSQTAIYARINLAQNLFCLKQRGLTEAERASSSPLLQACKISETKVKASEDKDASSWTEIEQILNVAIAQSRSLQDRRAEAYSLGYLGGIRQQQGQFTDAQALTQQAVSLATTFNAPDIAYLWQWQLGRLGKTSAQNPQDSLRYYTSAYNTLQSLRRDLVAIASEVQFSFRDSVEPVYRERVGLLLQSPQPSQENLANARDTIEALQLAELEDFFRDACLEAKPKRLDDIDPTATVIYPIILANRLDVILKLSGKEDLQYYSTPISKAEVEKTLTELQISLSQVDRTAQIRQLSQIVYKWLIQPAVERLDKSGTKTIAFVLDGTLRNIPMAVLFDGQKYLVEKYAIALTPGLQLLDPKPFAGIQLKAVAAGISEALKVEGSNFSKLVNVEPELDNVQSVVPGSPKLLNQSFTKIKLQDQLNAANFPVVHMATHGQFSSNSEQTFILSWDKLLRVQDLNSLLKTSDPSKAPRTIELLVLSACETAQGDLRATLGLAGFAVRAGARSTLATLWQVDDKASAELIARFYQELTKPNATKAEALRQAQLASIKKEVYYWAPYVLVGSWL
jgi:CHAT domain-containing protein